MPPRPKDALLTPLDAQLVDTGHQEIIRISHQTLRLATPVTGIALHLVPHRLGQSPIRLRSRMDFVPTLLMDLVQAIQRPIRGGITAAVALTPVHLAGVNVCFSVIKKIQS